MRRNLIAMSLLVPFIVAGAVQGNPVTVDFSGLGINSIDVTAENNPAGLTLSGVTFLYDNFGSGVDFASVDSSGIFGTTYGVLIFDFSGPATGLNFDFSLLSVSPSFTDPLFVILNSVGSDVVDMPVSATFVPYDPANPTLGDAVGTFAYSGLEFDQAFMYFAFDPSVIDPQYFSVANISYNSVPEPATLVLMVVGLFGLGGRYIHYSSRPY
jgi:hypothetical protein